MKQPKLSIITVTKNNALGLEATIESVLEQTLDSYEYIIIDGGSTDATTKIIEKYSDSLSFWVSEPDKGIYNAMNKGINKAKGQYCLFLNSGDHLVSPHILKDAFNLDFDEDYVYGNILLQKGNGNILKAFPPKLTFKYFYAGGYLPHPASFIKRDLFNKYGTYNEQLSIISDWEFTLKVLVKENCSYKHIDFPITCFDVNGASSNNERLKKEVDEILVGQYALFLDDYKDLTFYDDSRIFKLIKSIVKKLTFFK